MPPIPRTYSTEYQSKALDRETATMMQLTHTRCPQGVKILERRHSKTARQLIDHLPKRRRPRNIWKRFVGLLQRAQGVTPYDPMASIARTARRRSRWS